MGFNEKMVRLFRQACDDVIEDMISPTFEDGQAISGRKVDPRLPLLLADGFLE